MATPVPPAGAAILIRFVPSKVPAYDDARQRPPVTFSVSAVAAGGTVSVHAHSEGGWVFDINTGEGEGGEVLAVTGGSCSYGEGFSGDDCHADFTLTHDGVAAKVIVVYNTRPD
jgi:hypothetical protein